MVVNNQTPSSEPNIKRQTTDPKRRRFIMYSIPAIALLLIVFTVFVVQNFSSLVSTATPPSVPTFEDQTIEVTIQDRNINHPGGQIATCLRDAGLNQGHSVELNLNGETAYVMEAKYVLMCVDDLPYKLGENTLELALADTSASPVRPLVGHFVLSGPLGASRVYQFDLTATKSASAIVNVVIRENSDG